MILIAWLIMAAIAIFSRWLSSLITVGGTNPIEPMMIGIILGAMARNLGLTPKAWEPFLKKFETPLLWGIILLGAGFSISTAKELPLSLVVILVTMTVGFFAIYLLARRAGLSDKLSALLAVGTTICGGSAIAITSPLIKAKEEETCYAVSVIVVSAFILMITLPFLGSLLGMNETVFGIWAGTSVHNTPQTIGTGYIFGEESGQVATMVKFTRNMFMIVVAVLVSLSFKAKETTQKHLEKKAILKAFPWFLFGYLGMAIFAASGFFTTEGIDFFGKVGKFLILMGMVGIGFGTDFMYIKKLGYKPLVIGILGTVIVCLTSFLTIMALGFI
ncbi:MAG: YeiH family protein [Eubacteriales bacterium]